MPEEETENTRRLRHRDLLAELGTAALRGGDLDHLLQEASRIAADGMSVRFAKVLEYLPPEDTLLVRAGVGWREGVVGQARLGAGDRSPAGHALRTVQPVISNDLAADSRFRTPKLLLEHGVHRAINVIIRGDGVPFGVLEADGRMPGIFHDDDIGFLQAAANLLGVAIERSRRERELEEAIGARDLLLREADHRIKNSLQLVASLLSLQRSRLQDETSAAAFDAAISRVRAVAEAHRALFQHRDPRRVSFGRMLADICDHVGTLSPSVAIECQTVDDIEIDAERAIPLGLIVNELLTNAVRHAYAEGENGEVTASVAREGDVLRICIADHGRGIASDRPPSRSLGGSIVGALVRQIGVQMETDSQPGIGTSVTLRLGLSGEAVPPTGS